MVFVAALVRVQAAPVILAEFPFEYREGLLWVEVNIMLVSVTERTREIGVLKALGARRRHILAQFLIEGLGLTVTGGLLGFLLAGLVVKLIGSLPFLGPLFDDTSGRSDIHLAVSWFALIISSSILVVVGIIAGMIPAVRAARLDPVEAIRNE